MPNFKSVTVFFSFVKFSHSIFALPFALIGFFLGVKQTSSIDWMLFVLVVLCMIFVRNAAMGFNRLIDKDIDKKNYRTRNREIPSGKITPVRAIVFVIVNCVLFVITTFFINNLVFLLSPVVLVVVLGYSYTKRFTFLCHFVLGLGLSLAPIGAYLAVLGKFDLIPVLYSVIVLLWVSGFDVIYALQDFDFDSKELLQSVPVRIGKKNALILSLILHIFVAVLVAIAGFLAGFTSWYWIGAFIFIFLLAYQHLIIKPSDLSRINFAFFTLNGIASLIFGLFTVIQIMA